MRILYVTGHYPPDFSSGATMQVLRLAEAQVRAGHQVCVLAGSIRSGLADGETMTERTNGVTVRWLGTSTRIDQDVDENWLNPAATALMATVIADFRPEVIHAHALQTLGAELLAPPVTGTTPVVVTMHDFWWWCSRLFLVDRAQRPCSLDLTASTCPCARTAAWRIERTRRLGAVLETVAQVLVPSSSMRAILTANGLSPERVAVDENDVDNAAIARGGTVTHGDVRFLYIGGDHALKGRDVVLAAAERLRGRVGWQLEVRGVPDRRPRWRRHRRGRVHHLPAFDSSQAAAVYAAADVLLIPSIARESYSIAAREALGSGLAVVTSDCLGPTEVVVDGVNGRIVPIGDDGALAAAMVALIDDRQALARLREAARAAPPRLRDPAEHAASLVDRYRELIARAR